MREIFFRGKRVDNGKWVCGYLVIDDFNDKQFVDTIPITYSVDPETIGQYTGLTDMNGNKIFEGDIVKNIITGEKGVIQWFDERSAFMMWNRTKNAIYFLYDKTFSNIRIVGNVFDTPEFDNDNNASYLKETYGIDLSELISTEMTDRVQKGG